MTNPTIFNHGDYVWVPGPDDTPGPVQARILFIDHDPDLGDTDLVVAANGRRWTVNVGEVRPA